MKTLSLILLCLFSVNSANASLNGKKNAVHSASSTNKNALALIKKIEKKRANLKNKLKAQDLIKILQPDSIRQGDAYSLYFQSNTEITGTNSLIDLTIDSNPAVLEQPAKGLFIYHSSGESEIKTHNAVAKLSIEDTAEAKSLRDAITQLDAEIQALQDQIDEMEPGSEQDALIAQRDEKVAIKNQLVAALAAIKSPIGEEAFSFKIIAAVGNNPDFFRILSVAPSFGSVSGGTELIITGQRFPTGMDALLGNVAVPVTFVSSTEVRITSPDFTLPGAGGVGIKSLELKKAGATPQDPVKNATRSNVFYAANINSPIGNIKPVAVAGASQNANVGTEVAMNGSASYDENAGTTLTYAWKAISVPAGSGIATGVVYSADQSFNFTPSKPGSYVWELVVNDGEFNSEASLTVVTANPPTNSAPVPSASNPLAVIAGQSGTSQILHGDIDDYQAHSYVITKQSSLGAASVSSTGEVSFTAGTVSGSDALEVIVMDNGNPPLSGTVSIPVTVTPSNYAPVPTASAISAQPNATVTRQVTHGDPDAGQNHAYAITQQSAFGTASISSSGLITFEAGGAEGSDSIEVQVTDDGSPVLSGTISIPVTVALSEVSIGEMGYEIYQRGGITEVGVWADPISSSNGEVVSATWNFGDGTSEHSIEIGPDTDYSGWTPHDYMALGTYIATVTAVDSLGATNSKSFTFTLDNTDIPKTKLSVDTVSGAIPLTVNFDASASSDNEGITNYNWRWNDGTPRENTTVPMKSHTFTVAGHYRVRLVVKDAAGNRNDNAYVDIYAGVTPPAVGSLPSPVFETAAREVVLGSSISFDASGSFDPNPSGSITAYNWDFDDWATCGALGNGCLGTGVNPSYIYPSVGRYWPRVQVTGASGGVSEQFARRVIVVNEGYAPRAVLNKPINYRPYEGVAPFTANFDGSESYDYDGTITNYHWWFGDQNCSTDCDSTSVASSHTYLADGPYWASLTVTDNDQNTYEDGYEVIVYPNQKTMKASNKKRAGGKDPERERKKQMLAYACSRNQAPACYEVGKMHEEDGNAFAAGKYFEKACALGYSQACSAGISARLLGSRQH